MSIPASKVVLCEVDAEITFLGSLFMAPGAFAEHCTEVKPEWFSDPMLRYLFETARKLHDAGGRLSPPAVVAALPEDCNGIPRGAFYARVCAAAMPITAFRGLVDILKDRWGRRALLASADAVKARVDMFGEDPFRLASEVGDAAGIVAGGNATRQVETLDAAMDGLAAEGQERRGATTGLFALDNKLNGYVPGQLYVVAGRPGMGKSAFMCSSLRRTAQMGKGVAIFSLEMTSEEIAARCMSDALDTVSAPGFGDILRRRIDPVQRQDLAVARDSIAGIPLHVYDAPRVTFDEIAAKSRQVKAKLAAEGVPLSVVCIDHMGLVTPSERYAGNKVAEAGEISGQARALAKELDTCVLLLCQLSREVEKRDDKRPVMADLRWSGEIEQDAHVIGFLYRHAYYLQQDPNVDPHDLRDAQRKLDFLVRKNRNGETCDVSLWCSIAHSSIRDE